MQKTSFKFFIRCFAFAVILFLLCTWIYNNLKSHSLIDTSKNGIFYQDGNSLDILYVGNSHVYAAVKPSQIEEKTGLKGFNLTTSDMNAEAMYYYLKAVLRHQTPKYVALETYSFSIYEKSDAPTKLNTSNKLVDLPFQDRLRFVIDRAIEGDKDLVYVFFPLFMYHENWTDPQLFGKTIYSVDKGWFPFSNDHISFPNILVRQTATDYGIEYGMSQEAQKYFDRIINMLQSKRIKILFFTTPYYLVSEEYPVFHALNDYSVSNDIPFLNLSENDVLADLNFKREYLHDSQHVTESGATIVSDCLSDFLLQVMVKE